MLVTLDYAREPTKQSWGTGQWVLLGVSALAVGLSELLTADRDLSRSSIFVGIPGFSGVSILGQLPSIALALTVVFLHERRLTVRFLAILLATTALLAPFAPIIEAFQSVAVRALLGFGHIGLAGVAFGAAWLHSVASRRARWAGRLAAYTLLFGLAESAYWIFQLRIAFARQELLGKWVVRPDEDLRVFFSLLGCRYLMAAACSAIVLLVAASVMRAHRSASDPDG